MASYYSDSIDHFLADTTSYIIDQLAKSDAASGFLQLSHLQVESWRQTIDFTKEAVLASGHQEDICGVIFEYRVPRREKRIDCVIVTKFDSILVEYKQGKNSFNEADEAQGVDYSLDIANYHEVAQSHRIHLVVCPTSYSSEAFKREPQPGICSIWVCGSNELGRVIARCIDKSAEYGTLEMSLDLWVGSRYRPVPTILDAVNILFAENDLGDIQQCLSSSDALEQVVSYISGKIAESRHNRSKLLLLVSGVPGSGKTLVGLKLAHMAHQGSDDRFVYMSGNGPLLKVLKASLAKSFQNKRKLDGHKCTVVEAKKYSEAMLHSVHSFIEEGRRTQQPPIENVIIFDEAQRAWSRNKMLKMNERQKKYNATNNLTHPKTPVESEPLTLLQIMSRSEDGAVVVALCGNGQEIHDGEAGINEWVSAGEASPGWSIVSSPIIEKTLKDSSAPRRIGEEAGAMITDTNRLTIHDDLHLREGMRTHRAKWHAKWVNSVLDGMSLQAGSYVDHNSYPIFVTRNLDLAKEYLESFRNSSRRYGLLASSGASRLRPHGIEVSSDFRKGIDYALWFTAERGDFRSSYALESAATEFECQGLEVDWAIVAWCWDYIVDDGQQACRALRGQKWTQIKNTEKIEFLVNKYRVLLSRAREGLILYLPVGSKIDATRPPFEMDHLEQYLIRCGARAL